MQLVAQTILLITMMKRIEQQPHIGTTGERTRPEPLVSFLINLLELVAAEYQSTCSHPKEQPQRHSFVIVTDNARIHPKHSCLCTSRQMDTSMPRATSCPSNLSALCCFRRTNMSMMRVASTGNLSRWDAHSCGFVDKKSDGAARPPLRTWDLDHEDLSDQYDDSHRADNDDDNADDDFGTFVQLEEDEDEDYLPMARGTPQSSDWKSLSLSSAPAFTAMPLWPN
jgi:hypothetical protein